MEERKYTKELVLKDLKYKLEEIQELKNGVSWIIDHYERGTLPE